MLFRVNLSRIWIESNEWNLFDVRFNRDRCLKLRRSIVERPTSLKSRSTTVVNSNSVKFIANVFRCSGRPRNRDRRSLSIISLVVDTLHLSSTISSPSFCRISYVAILHAKYGFMWPLVTKMASDTTVKARIIPESIIQVLRASIINDTDIILRANSTGGWIRSHLIGMSMKTWSGVDGAELASSASSRERKVEPSLIN